MRIRGGQIFGAGRRERSIAGWARGALALAMALFVVAQATAFRIGHAGAAHAEGLSTQYCKKPAALSNNDAASLPAPVSASDHDCGACLACNFPSAVGTASDANIVAAAWREASFPWPDGVAAPLSRRFSAHSPRAPPSFS
jgi:hypothetical protein